MDDALVAAALLERAQAAAEEAAAMAARLSDVAQRHTAATEALGQAREIERLARHPFPREWHVDVEPRELLRADPYDDRHRERTNLVCHLARLAELATSGAKMFLQDYVAALPPGQGGAVRRAAEDAAMRIAD
jgi:hypothetical protein